MVFTVARGFQVALEVKNLPSNAGDLRSVSLSPGLGRPPAEGHGNPLQFSCLENPMHRGAWQAIVHRVTIFTVDEWIYQTSHSQSVAELGFRTNGSNMNPMFLPALFMHSQREGSHQERHWQGRKHWHCPQKLPRTAVGCGAGHGPGWPWLHRSVCFGLEDTVSFRNSALLPRTKAACRRETLMCAGEKQPWKAQSLHSWVSVPSPRSGRRVWPSLHAQEARRLQGIQKRMHYKAHHLHLDPEQGCWWALEFLQVI